MNRGLFHLAATLFWGAAVLLLAPDSPAAQTERQLQERMSAYLAQPKFSSALWGVKVVALDSGKTWFAEHADRLMSPASNTKLFSGALALDQLGGGYRIETPVYATGPVAADGTLPGDLVVVGQGDPTWNERQWGTNFWAIFDPFVAVLTNAGVHHVQGDLVADATFFRGPPMGAGWYLEDLREGEVGLMSALTLDDNLAWLQVAPAQLGAPCRLTLQQSGTGLVFSNQTVTVESNRAPHVELYRPVDSRLVYVLGELPRHGRPEVFPVAVMRPAEWFVAALKLALARHGIKVEGHTRVVGWPQPGGVNPGWVKLGAVASPPLREVVRSFMKQSLSLDTDLVLAHVGEKTRAADAPAWETSSGCGLAAMRRFLSQAGVPPGEVYFDEGSGLSRENLTTADATVALLQFMARHREADAFLASLPIAGADGTLQARFHGTAAAGNVRAKTGTLHWASTLSGYVTTAAGERLAFSILLNRFAAAPGHGGHDEIDPLVLMLANFDGRE